MRSEQLSEQLPGHPACRTGAKSSPSAGCCPATPGRTVGKADKHQRCAADGGQWVRLLCLLLLLLRMLLLLLLLAGCRGSAARFPASKQPAPRGGKLVGMLFSKGCAALPQDQVQQRQACQRQHQGSRAR